MTVYFQAILVIVLIARGVNMIVVASIRSWDGCRILGAFKSKDEAFEKCEAAGFNTKNDSFYLDIMEINKVSDAYSLIVSDKDNKNFIKKHLYASRKISCSEDNKDMNT